jgi:hypothetical protein
MMKSFLFILLFVLLNLNRLNGFITYPFTSNQWLDKILSSIQPIEEIIVPKIVKDIDIEEDLMKYAINGEECVRKCAKNDKRVCHYNFTLRYYQVLGG